MKVFVFKHSLKRGAKFSHLEETVVGADGDIVRLGDVVHQSPEVFHCVKGGYLHVGKGVCVLCYFVLDCSGVVCKSQMLSSITKLNVMFHIFQWRRWKAISKSQQCH